MKVVLRRRFVPPLKSWKTVAIARGQNPQDTKKNMRTSWDDTIIGDACLPASDWKAIDINSYETKLGFGVPYSKSMHAEFFFFS